MGELIEVDVPVGDPDKCLSLARSIEIRDIDAVESDPSPGGSDEAEQPAWRSIRPRRAAPWRCHKQPLSMCQIMNSRKEPTWWSLCSSTIGGHFAGIQGQGGLPIEDAQRGQRIGNEVIDTRSFPPTCQRTDQVDPSGPSLSKVPMILHPECHPLSSRGLWRRSHPEHRRS